jgi:membrane protein DedA with SNARE-associated domain
VIAVPDLRELIWPLVGFFVSLFAGGFGLPPIPEELPVVLAGLWVAGKPELGILRWLALPVCIAAILISDISLYGVGRFLGVRLWEHRLLSRLLPPERRERIETNLRHYGLRIMLLIRWVPGIRSPMFVTAGTMRLPWYRFLLFDAVGATIGHTTLFFLAWWFGDVVLEYAKQAEQKVGTPVKLIVLAAIITLVGVGLAIHFWRRPVVTADPTDVPLIGPQVAAKIEQASSKVLLRPVDAKHQDGRPQQENGALEISHPPARQQS